MKRAVQGNFDVSVDAYAGYESRTGRFAALARRLGRAMVEATDGAAGDRFRRLLDAGAGTGASTLPLAERAETVVALDLSRAMLAANPGPLRVQGDFDHLPFRDGSFDAVAFTASLFLVPDPARAAREAHRVLRPGGAVGAVALEGWRDETGGDVFDRVGRDSRSPATATDVEAALRGTFRVETGTWSFPSSAADLRAFHRIPALAARLYPTLPPDERVERAGDLLASLDGEFEQVWRWVVGVRE